MNFKSDNTAGICPEILEAIVASNNGFDASYGSDSYSKKLTHKVSEIFEHDVTLFLTSTGTAANVLALSALVPPYGAVYCHPRAHINTDECGAPEFFTGGKLVTVAARGSHIDPLAIEQVIKNSNLCAPHASKPSALSVTQLTEDGTVYSLPELAAVGDLARRYGLRVHMDGARFANALVSLDCSPAQMSWQSGVDVLCLGGTKNGAMMAEMIVFFDKGLAKDFEYKHKRAGQLMSKTRFVAAQFLAYFKDDIWLKNARHANAMAARLAEVLSSVAGVELVYPVQGNEIFVRMPKQLADLLIKGGAQFYQWDGDIYRLVTSFATTKEDVTAFEGLIKTSERTLREKQ